jgi:hypothetical protein
MFRIPRNARMNKNGLALILDEVLEEILVLVRYEEE